MKKMIIALAFMGVTLTESWGYPVMDQIVPTAGLPIRVYPDHATPGVYWYIPQSIEPWKRDNRYRSSLYRSNSVLSFIFRGQASVDPAILTQVAAALNTAVGNLTPIAYEYSKNFVCQNIFAGETGLTWLFPPMIGNYLEVVPVSLRSTRADLNDELAYHLGEGGGLGCTVEVGFKGVSTAYHLKVSADLDQVYSRFELAAHAEAFWWEVDVHTLLENLRREHVITFESLEDGSIPETEMDKKVNAAMDEVVKQITSAMFTPALKLPNEPMAGRGKPFSLRVDYRRSTEHTHWEATLDSRKVTVKDTQISVRMSNE